MLDVGRDVVSPGNQAWRRVEDDTVADAKADLTAIQHPRG